MQVLLELPYLLPRWCMDHIKFTLHAHRALDKSPPLSQSFFDVVAVLLNKEKLVLEDVCKQLAAEFDRLPDVKSMIELVKDAISEMTPSTGNVLLASNLDLDLSTCDGRVSELMNLPQWPAMQFMLAMVSNGKWWHVRVLLRQTKFKFLLHRDIFMAVADRLEATLSQHAQILFPSGPLGPCILPVPDSNSHEGIAIASPFSQEALQMLEVCSMPDLRIRSEIGGKYCGLHESIIIRLRVPF